ncbi:HAD family hydrolase [Martelella mediterranea]|uniref:Putative hydrolase of the HAD superfamily n=1 Tax=Martelella mediterranea TaxID=293089 RepID=A0A4R3NK02_9HYPH|nr:HAD-IA family hydrolase [Martelella mediterranea]TCT33098.1 putative hydrolase of the HAD superfamily [Martelella mediterranea]
MKKCLMLDVDGVLVHPQNSRSWADDMKQDLGIDPDRLTAEFFNVHWREVILGRKKLESALQACLPGLSATVTAKDFMAYWFERDSAVDAAVLDDLCCLKNRGLSIYLATNQEHQRACYLMDAMGLAAHVDGIVYSAALGVKKPSDDFFAHAETKTGFSANEIVFVDDSKANIDAAFARGWTAFHWTGEERLIDLIV